MNRLGMKRMLLFIVLALSSIYIGAVLYLYFYQEKLIYNPERQITVTPREIGLSFDKVFFHTQDDIKLSAWFVTAKKARGTVLFCHGNGGNISGRLEIIKLIHKLRLNILIFDYRGYGESEGTPSENGTYLDAEAARNYLIKHQKIEPNELIIWGRSLGGAIASWLAQKQTPKILIIESTFTSIQDIASELFFFLPIKLISRINYNTKERINQITCPILVVHSRDDEMIPFRHGNLLFELANKPKDFLEINGSHNEGYRLSIEHYEQGLEAFITKYFTH